MAEYRFLFDEGFLIQAFRRYRRQHGTRRVLMAIKVVAAVLLVPLAVFAVAHRVWWLAAFFLALVILMFNAHLIDFFLIKRQFRKSPYRDEHVVITLAAEGVHAVSSKSDSKLTWAVFTKARRFHDGFPVVFNWLPEPALTEGTAADVESLIKTHVRDYRIVESARR